MKYKKLGYTVNNKLVFHFKHGLGQQATVASSNRPTSAWFTAYCTAYTVQYCLIFLKTQYMKHYPICSYKQTYAIQAYIVIA